MMMAMMKQKVETFSCVLQEGKKKIHILHRERHMNETRKLMVKRRREEGSLDVASKQREADTAHKLDRSLSLLSFSQSPSFSTHKRREATSGSEREENESQETFKKKVGSKTGGEALNEEREREREGEEDQERKKEENLFIRDKNLPYLLLSLSLHLFLFFFQVKR